MKKINFADLNTLFSCLNENPHLLWVRDKDYTKQLYVGPSFESIWEMPTSALYDNPDMFMETVISDKFSNYILKASENRKKADEEDWEKDTKAMKPLWRIKTASGKIKYIYDNPMMLLDNMGNHVGFCGVGGELSQEAWFEQYYAQELLPSKETQHNFSMQIFEKLQQQTGMHTVPMQEQKKSRYFSKMLCNNQEIFLTTRETQIMEHLLLGHSAKETARELNISHRTVESHICNLKEKAYCRTTMELLGKVIADKKKFALLKSL